MSFLLSREACQGGQDFRANSNLPRILYAFTLGSGTVRLVAVSRGGSFTERASDPLSSAATIIEEGSSLDLLK